MNTDKHRSIVFQTQRLSIKPVALSDLNELVKLCTNPEVMRYVGDGSIQTAEEVLAFIHTRERYYQQYGLDFFSVFKSDTGEFVGQAGLFHLAFDISNHDIWLAYRLQPQFWHKGYATELAKALINWGFNELSLTSILAFVHPQNKHSQRVLENAGMSYCGLKDYNCVPRPYYSIHNSIDAVHKTNESSIFAK